MDADELKKIIKDLPGTPGVYIFKGRKGKILYIGKAINLKKRVSSYLRTPDQRIKKMVEEAESVSHTACISEIEALLLECQMIKHRHPPFNILMRDDKLYSYVCFSDEQFPKIFVSNQPVKNRHAKIGDYIGPFTDGYAIRSTVRYLRRIFPYCTCFKPHHNFCLNYHIGKCPGFCCLKKVGATKEEIARYKNNVKVIKEILSGKRKTVIKELTVEMKKLALEHKFEQAGDIKIKIENLERVFENADVLSKSTLLDDEETFHDNLARPELKQMKEIFKLKNPPYRIEGYDISNIQGRHATGSMVVFENGRPNKNEYRKFRIRGLATTLPTVFANRFKTPKRVSDKFGDTGMLKEILARRFHHNEWRMPDLIIIDGGKGQLNAAYAAISNFQPSISKIPIIALAKDDRHTGIKVFTKDARDAHALSEMPSIVRNLILEVDSQAHRFALKFYRKLHRRSVGSNSFTEKIIKY